MGPVGIGHWELGLDNLQVNIYCGGNEYLIGYSPVSHSSISRIDFLGINFLGFEFLET